MGFIMLCRETELLTDILALYGLVYNDRPGDIEGLITMKDIESLVSAKPAMVPAKDAMKRCLAQLDETTYNKMHKDDASLAVVVSLVLREVLQSNLSRFEHRVMGTALTGWVELGQLLATGGLGHDMREKAHSLVPFFNQHAQMAWGELEPTDLLENDMALLFQVVQEQMASLLDKTELAETLLAVQEKQQEGDIPALYRAMQQCLIAQGDEDLASQITNPDSALARCLVNRGRLFSKYELEDGQHIYLITDFETETTPRTTTAMYTDDY